MSVDVNYCSFSVSRADARWEKLNQKVELVKISDWEYRFFDEELIFCLDDGSLNYFLGKEVDDEILMQDLKFLDLQFGGTIAGSGFDGFEVWENLCLESMAEILGLNLKEKLLSKDDWKKIFPLKKEDIAKIVDLIAKKQNEEGAGESYQISFREYLTEIKPVIKDLINTSDADFLRLINNVEYIEPLFMREMLEKRAIEHSQGYLLGIGLNIVEAE